MFNFVLFPDLCLDLFIHIAQYDWKDSKTCLRIPIPLNRLRNKCGDSLNQQVNSNEDRFPEDFMFQLTKEEWENLKSQNVISSWGGRRKLPNAFTEHGVLMSSSVLKSKRVIVVNIHIKRVYSKMKEVLLTNKEILKKLSESEKNDLILGQNHKKKKLQEMLYSSVFKSLKLIKKQEKEGQGRTK